MSQASSGPDLKHTLDLVLDQLANVVIHESSAILLLDGDQIEVVTARGYLAETRSYSYSLASSPLLAKILNSTQPITFNGHIADEVFYGLACYGLGCSCINIPLRTHEKPIGFLTINRHGTKGYTNEESQLLIVFARQTALTIENMRLYDEARRRALQLETAAQVGRQLTLLQDLDHLLAETVKVIRENFGYYQTHILLVDSATNKVVLKEASGPATDLIKSRGLRLTVGEEGITVWGA